MVDGGCLGHIIFDVTLGTQLQQTVENTVELVSLLH